MPEQSTGALPSHEAICVLNTTDRAANISITFYFEDQDAIRGIKVVVPAERTRHLRIDQPEQLGGLEIPRGVPYAIRLASDVPVVVQHSRLDTTQPALSLMTTVAYPVMTS